MADRTITTSATTSTTIAYNVGGTIYDVPSHVINKHPNSMLARIASDTWNQTDAARCNDSNDQAIFFINGNGTRFRYCIDYLTTGTANLPRGMPKQAVLSDLEYYGIENVDDTAILESLSDAIQILKASWNQNNFDEKQLVQDFQSAALDLLLHYVVEECFRARFRRASSSTEMRVSYGGLHWERVQERLLGAEIMHYTIFESWFSLIYCQEDKGQSSDNKLREMLHEGQLKMTKVKLDYFSISFADQRGPNEKKTSWWKRFLCVP